MPQIDGYVHASDYEPTTHTVYIAGDFTHVGGLPRNHIAAININTGTVLPNLASVSINFSLGLNSIKKIKLYNHKLYVGGLITGGDDGVYSSTVDQLFAINLINDSLIDLGIAANYQVTGVNDFEIYKDKIYFAFYGPCSPPTNAPYQGLAVIDTNGIPNASWTPTLNYCNGTALLKVTDVLIKNNSLYVAGNFNTMSGSARNMVARFNLSNNSLNGYNPTISFIPNSCNESGQLVQLNNKLLLTETYISCTSNTKILGFDTLTGTPDPFFSTINSAYSGVLLENDNDSTLLVSPVQTISIGGNIHKNIARINVNTNTTDGWDPILNTGGISSIKRFSDYLLLSGGFDSLDHRLNKYYGIYCLPPPQPKFANSSTTICEGKTNVNYSIDPIPGVSNYIWSYSGTNTIINGSGTSVALDFLMGSSSGTLSVIAYSSCGSASKAATINITVNPLPNVFAGTDITFNCTHTIDTLKGNSTTTGVAYHWSGPGGFSKTSSQVQVQLQNTLAGSYALTVTNTITGCIRKDVAQIFVDTLKPMVNHLSGSYVLSCANQNITLDASANYPINDTLKWAGTSFSSSNPAHVTNSGNYILTITSGTNGCKNYDTIGVTGNTTPPNLTMPVSIDTITCLRDSVLLDANSTTSQTFIFWQNSNGDTLIDPIYVHQSGVYTITAISTYNGCKTINVGNVSQFTTPPQVILPAGNFSINCSANSAVLDGSSPNQGASLLWTGPTNYSSTDPATVNQLGYYVLTVTHPKNGCTAKDSINIAYQNTLVVHASNDTTICNGTSALLAASAVGGTPGFTYSWTNSGGSSASTSVNPTDTTTYVVTINDNAGCVGTDTVIVNVPALINDSIFTYQPCDPNNVNGQIQIYPYGGIPPYQFSIDTGNTFQSSAIFSNLNYGNYAVEIKDAGTCTHTINAAINFASQLATPDFIISTSQSQSDTFVVVDISNPRPDSITWSLPSTCHITNHDSFAPQIVNTDTGSFTITMNAFFGSCEMSLSKTIHVHPFDTSAATAANNNGIESITLYPNPNTGQFNVDVQLYKKQNFAIFIYDATGIEQLRIPTSGLDHYQGYITMPQSTPGTYVLRVIAEFDSKQQTFVITQ